MAYAASIVVALVAALHVYFLVLEMFLWTTPRTRAAFGMTVEQAEHTKVMAGNQGLYNGFLAAGLLWGVSGGDAAYPIKLFFLGCVIVAGIFGGFTAKRSILWMQAFPGLLALLAVIAAHRS